MGEDLYRLKIMACADQQLYHIVLRVKQNFSSLEKYYFVSCI